MKLSERFTNRKLTELELSHLEDDVPGRERSKSEPPRGDNISENMKFLISENELLIWSSSFRLHWSDTRVLPLCVTTVC